MTLVSRGLPGASYEKSARLPVGIVYGQNYGGI